MKADALTDLASTWLAERYPDALIIRELSIGAWGSAVLDVAAIMPNEIIGCEIKGEGDTVKRLAMQEALYSKAATRMFLLADESLALKCKKELRGLGWSVRVPGEGLPTVIPRMHNAPAQLLEALIGDELKRICKTLGEAVPKSGSVVQTMLDTLSENYPLSTLRPLTCRALRERDWAAWHKKTKRDRPLRVRWAKDIGAAR